MSEQLRKEQVRRKRMREALYQRMTGEAPGDALQDAVCEFKAPATTPRGVYWWMYLCRLDDHELQDLFIDLMFGDGDEDERD